MLTIDYQLSSDYVRWLVDVGNAVRSTRLKASLELGPITYCLWCSILCSRRSQYVLLACSNPYF